LLSGSSFPDYSVYEYLIIYNVTEGLTMTVYRIMLMIGIAAVSTGLHAEEQIEAEKPVEATVEKTAVVQTEQPAEKPAEEKAISLKENLMPLFARSCAGCHKREGGNPKAIEHKIFYEKPEDVMAQVGRLIIAGAPEKSKVVYLLTPPKNPNERKEVMPPPRSNVQMMSEKEIALISTWIKQGAKNN